jgi:hypothetical protein
MVEIDKRLYQEIKDYCKLNNLIIKDFINKLLKKAFTIEKYGDKPFADAPFITEANPPNESLCTNILVPPTNVNSEIIKNREEHYWESLGDDKPYEVETIKTNEPEIVKKSKKRKLN